MKNAETPFSTALKAEIRKYIRTARQDGTLGMSLDNLRQCVKTPNTNLPGAPLGTNARYYYAELFREVCQDRTIAGFIL